jgi:hypothetical protein
MGKYGDSVKARIKRSQDEAVERADWRDSYKVRSASEQEQEWKDIEKSLNDAIEKNMEFDSMGREWLNRHNAAKNRDLNQRILESMQRRLVFSCLQPLSEDFSLIGAMTAIGMFSAYMATNPQMNDRFMKGVNRYRAAKYERMAAEAKEHPEKFGNRFRAARWERLYEKYARKANDGRVPLTPESAANMKLAYEKRRYDDTRAVLRDFKDGNISEDERDSRLEDIDLLHEEHIDTLYRVAQADGLEIKDIDREERIMVDRLQRFDETSKYGFMFEGLAQKRVAKAPATERTYRVPDGKGGFTTEHVKVWNGEYVDSDGSPWEHGFEARQPYSKELLANDIADAMAVSYQDAADFAMTGNPNGLAETKLMLINMMNQYAHPDQELLMPDEMINDDENALLMGCYSDLYRMAGEDSMSYGDMVKATGLGAAQGFSAWMSSESLHNSYELGHDTVQDLQYAVEFAAISRHVDPESERWENMANEYFSQVFPDDKFDAPDPDDVREAEQKKVDAAMAEVRRLEEKVADCEGRVAVDTKRANEASVRVNAADEASDEYDALVSRHEKLSTVAFNSERSLEDAKASLRRAKKEAEDARKHRDEQIERAEKLQSDKLSHDEATEANRIRRDGAISMSRNFVACARQAEAFGNTPGEAWDAVTKGVGKGITAWADDDVDNFRFAKAAHEHAASRTLRFAHVYCDNDEWEKVDPTPTAEDYATNVFEVVRDRYSKKKSYGEQAAERFGMDYDDIESDPYEDYYGGN